MSHATEIPRSSTGPKVIRFASQEEMEEVGIDLSDIYSIQKEAIKDFNTILNPLFTTEPSAAFFVPPVLLDEEVTARLLGLTPDALQKRRSRGDISLPWKKIGKPVRYKLNDVLTYDEYNCIPGHDGNPSTIH